MDEIRLYIKILTGRKCPILAQTFWSFSQFRLHCSDTGISDAVDPHARFIHGGRQLDHRAGNDRTLQDFELQHDDTIIIVLHIGGRPFALEVDITPPRYDEIMDSTLDDVRHCIDKLSIDMRAALVWHNPYEEVKLLALTGTDAPLVARRCFEVPNSRVMCADSLTRSTFSRLVDLDSTISPGLMLSLLETDKLGSWLQWSLPTFRSVLEADDNLFGTVFNHILFCAANRKDTSLLRVLLDTGLSLYVPRLDDETIFTLCDKMDLVHVKHLVAEACVKQIRQAHVGLAVLTNKRVTFPRLVLQQFHSFHAPIVENVAWREYLVSVAKSLNLEA